MHITPRNWIFGIFLMICLNEILLCYQFANAYNPDTFICDHVAYAAMTNAFITHHFSAVAFPFNQRILLPFIVSLLPFNNITTGFHVINWISINIAMALLITLWIRLKAPLSLIFFMVLWIALNKSVAPFFFANIVNTDVMGFFFNAILVWIILKRNYYGLMLIAPLATLERESFISSLCIIFVCETIRFMKEKENKPLLLASLAFAIGLFVNHLTNTHLFSPGEGSSLGTVTFWIKSRAQHPVRLLEWFCESATILGGLPLLLKYVKHADFKNYVFIILGLLSLSFIAFGLLAGTAMSRISWGGMPFIATLFLYITAHAKMDKNIIRLIYISSLLILGIEYIIPWQIESLGRDATIYITTLLMSAVYIFAFITSRLFFPPLPAQFPPR